MFKVAVVYHIWPHYRAGVIEALDRSDLVSYEFLGSGEVLEGIEHIDVALMKRFVRAPSRRFLGVTWQPKATTIALGGSYDAVIFLGDIHFLSTWIGAALARVKGVPVLFWAHGWLRPETGSRRMLRKIYYRLANRMLVYGERARELGVAAGYPADRISVVYNSLDVDCADAVFARIDNGELADQHPRAYFEEPGLPLVICTARLIAACRFEVLFEAVALMKGRGQAVNILLIGDGPERVRLESQAKELGISVYFFGACYDEDVTGQLTYHADLTVSPGKIGLTAMHSLMYGTPAITHSNLDEQMPEVEAIEPGRTGAFFAQGDVQDLARAMTAWLAENKDRALVRQRCRAMIHDKWNPTMQAKIIEDAVIGLVGHG